MLKDISPESDAASIRRARRLRRTMSLPEVKLWRALRERPHGVKFRRQHASGSYVLDFYCADARLAIEVDGFAHDTQGRPERDAARDAWFARAGIETLRVPARDVLNAFDATVTSVIVATLARLPLHHPATRGGPPPRDKLGEDVG